MIDFPDFVIVGGQKCGTGSLHRWLGDHPGCFLSELKEPHYFARFTPTQKQVNHQIVVRSESEYKELFNPAEISQICGESSPSYLFEDGVADRIHNAVPDCKIIISVRDPVERAYSEYLMYVIAGIETRSFHQAILDSISEFPKRSWSEFPLYLELGCFGSQVRRYFNNFPRCQILIITLDEIVRDNAGLMRKISSFLDIDRSFWDTYMFPVRHSGMIPRNSLAKHMLASELARSVGSFFIPHRYRQLMVKKVFGKRRPSGLQNDEISSVDKEIIWDMLSDEILLLEQVTGTRFPDLWKSCKDVE